MFILTKGLLAFSKIPASSQIRREIELLQNHSHLNFVRHHNCHNITTHGIGTNESHPR